MRSSFLVEAVFLLLATDVNGSNKKRRHKANDTVYERRRVCEAGTCGHLVPLEANNCVNECVSAACYRKTFAEPLEDGEVNTQLSKIFMACARRETKSTAYTQKRSRRREADNTAAAAASEGGKPEGSRESVVLADGAVGDVVRAEAVLDDDELLIVAEDDDLDSYDDEEEEEDDDDEAVVGGGGVAEASR